MRNYECNKLSILGSNANGLKNKISSLEFNISVFRPSIITIQETKAKQRSQFKLRGYETFEKIREGCLGGGGLLTAIDENLNPFEVPSDISDDTEVLIVQFSLGSDVVRVINAYGPQEDDGFNTITQFWLRVEKEIALAKDLNCKVIVQLDANAKLGADLISGDPHPQSPNGSIMWEMILRHGLVVANTSPKCMGVITRQKQTQSGLEKSVLDYILVCESLGSLMETLMIDEQREFVLTSYTNYRGVKKATPSDHNIMYCTFSLDYRIKPKSLRKEIFCMRDTEGQKTFFNETSGKKDLASSFSQPFCFSHNSNVFFKKLKSCIHNSFKKVRIVKRGKKHEKTRSYTDLIMLKKHELSHFLNVCKCPENLAKVKQEIVALDDYLAEEIGSRNAAVVKEHIASLESDSGCFSNLKLWKLKRKLCPMSIEPPMVKKDDSGRLLTSPNGLKKLYLEAYRNRLRQRDMKAELMDVYFLKEELWKSRMIELDKQKTCEWAPSELKHSLKSLKSNKTPDPNGMINEIFKDGCIGSDLEQALLHFFNGIKEHMYLPDFVIKQNISSIYKNKGSRMEIKNERGIFVLTTLKKILDKLLYFDLHEDIDNNMSDSNIGARSGRQVKDHLFIIYGIINSVICGNEPCIDIQIYDLKQAFDSLWLTDCMIDLFDTLSDHNRNEKLSLLYKSNQKNLVAINTPHGITERINIRNIVQQGGTWGPLLCSNSIDTIGKQLWNEGRIGYLYKNSVNILPLAMVDDVNVISRCGSDSVILNSYINSKIELKKLEFHVPDASGKSKCHKMHVGNRNIECPKLKVHGTPMEEVSDDVYLGDVICSTGKNVKNVEKRVSRGMGIISQITNLLQQVSFGYHYLEIGLLLREALFISSILNNAEVWYRVTKNEIENLEAIDLILLRKLLRAPLTTPKEGLYLELGVIPLGILLKSRRIKYLHYLMSKEDKCMLSRFFWLQWRSPTKGDWVLTVQQDLKDFGIPCDIGFIKSFTAQSFKNLVKLKTKEYAFRVLLIAKENHSKMTNLTYHDLKLQSYLTLKNIHIDDLRMIFLYRVRMLKFSENYRGTVNDSRCPICVNHVDSQNLLTSCSPLTKQIDAEEMTKHIENIYTEDVTEGSVKLLVEVLKIRGKLLDKCHEGPSAPT